MAGHGLSAEIGDHVRGWLVFFALATAGTVLMMVANPGRGWPATLASAGLVLATQAVYALFARPRQSGIRTDGTRAWVFAVVAVVLLGPAVSLNIWSTASLAVLTPELFLLFTFGRASAVVVALNAVATMATVLSGGHTLRSVVQQVAIGIFVLTLSLLFGSRMLAVTERSAERLRLISALRDREAEVSALSAAQGAEHERNRMAQEMHDTLAQGFTSIVTLGHATLGELDTDPATARRHVEMITRTAAENLAESRRIIKGLSPARLEGSTLVEAVQRIVAGFSEETGTAARTQVEGPVVPAAPMVEVVALRVVQEGLANVRKHAQATEVEVRLAYLSDAIEVCIRDDGIGFDIGAPPTGFGLTGMRARVSEAGGEVDVQSAVAGGTAITVRVPVGAAA